MTKQNLEFNVHVTNEGEEGVNAFMNLELVDAHLSGDNDNKYVTDFFNEHNQFTARIILQHVPKNHTLRPKMNKKYKLILEEVEE